MGVKATLTVSGKRHSLALLPLLILAGNARADLLTDMASRSMLASKAMIGQTYWIAKPFNQGLELCPSAVRDFKKCQYVFDVEFTVRSTTPNYKLGQAFLDVELKDGRKGFLNATFSEHFLRAPIPADKRARILQCAVSQPSVGMNAQDVNECWGPAASVNSTTTAGGRTDQLVFPNRGYVYLQNGVVTAVQTSR